MKQTLIRIMLVIVLVFIAGCVAFSDPIVGSWKVDEAYIDGARITYTEDISFAFNSDNSGTYSFLDEQGSMTWECYRERGYTVTFDDFSTASFVLEGNQLLLFLGDSKLILYKD